MTFCKECGAEVKKDALFCLNCGVKREIPQPKHSRRELRITKKQLIIVSGILLAVILLAVMNTLFNTPPSVEVPTTTVEIIKSETTQPTTTTLLLTTTTEQTTTTTTLPRYVLLNSYDMGKCKDSMIGKVNTVYVDIPDTFVDLWRYKNPEESILYTCDSSQMEKSDVVLYKGGANIQSTDNLKGSYRLMLKCGNTAKYRNLQDCKNFKVYFDREALNKVTTTSTIQSYKINAIILDVEKPDGTVVQTQISKMANGIVDDIEVAGVYAEEADAVATASILLWDTTTHSIASRSKHKITSMGGQNTAVPIQIHINDQYYSQLENLFDKSKIDFYGVVIAEYPNGALEEWGIKGIQGDTLYIVKYHVLDDISSEGYTSEYMGYKFKIDHLIY